MARRAQPAKKRTTKQPQATTSRQPRNSEAPTTAEMQRPDHSILEDVDLHLAFYADRDTRAVEVAVEEGEVHLTGEVAEDSHRIHAERVAAAVPGARRVRNRIAVQQQGQQGQAAPVSPEPPPTGDPGQRPNPAQ
jgi:osmotically-inducible protein OsmY